MSDWADDKSLLITGQCTCHEAFTGRKLIDPQCMFHEFFDEIAAALRKAREDALEEAARVAYGFTGAQHAAHDMKAGIFPLKSHMGEAIADRIRNLKEKT